MWIYGGTVATYWDKENLYVEEDDENLVINIGSKAYFTIRRTMEPEEILTQLTLAKMEGHESFQV